MRAWPIPRRLTRPVLVPRAVPPPLRAVPLPRAEVARRDWPRLRVWRHPIVGNWAWRVTGPGEELGAVPIDWGWASSHAEALAVGLAALEQASVGRSGR